MPKRNIVWVAIALVLAVILWKAPEYFVHQEKLYEEYYPLLQVSDLVKKNYVEEVEDSDLVRGAIRGILNELDQHSVYFDPIQNKKFHQTTEGKFHGIGVVIEQKETGELLIVSPIEGSPAFEAGLRSGDLIIEVDGEKTYELSLTRCVEMITGEPGTTVKLRIRRPSTRKTFARTIARGVIKLRTVRGWARDVSWEWDYVIDKENHIGYIRISSFERVTSEQLDDAVRILLARHRMRGLILDLRDNPGGLLDVAVNTANRFLTKGTIVSVKYRSTTKRIYQANREQQTYPQFPIVILVNEGTASAAEIVSGALRDHGRATLVGTTTHGKGSVQELFPIESRGRREGTVKLTTAYYYLPNGTCIHKKGVRPDVELEMTPEQIEAVHESRREVNAVRPRPSTTQTATAPTTAPTTQQRIEIVIDPQLEKALEIMRQRLQVPASKTALGNK
jgi:carboxyl-terminal processing protease